MIFSVCVSVIEYSEDKRFPAWANEVIAIVFDEACWQLLVKKYTLERYGANYS